MKLSKDQISFHDIRVKDKNIFNNMARTYFKELDRKFKPTIKWNKKYLKSLIKKKNCFAKWIKIEETKLGFIIYQIAPNIFTGNKKIIIKNFFIKQNFRSKKIGNTSIKKLFKFTKTKKIELEVLKNNKKAKKFWSKFRLNLLSKRYSISI